MEAVSITRVDKMGFTPPCFIYLFACSVFAASNKLGMMSYNYTDTGDINRAHRWQTLNWPLFGDVLQVNCWAYAVLIESKDITAMISQGHVTTASLKQPN